MTQGETSRPGAVVLSGSTVAVPGPTGRSFLELSEDETRELLDAAAQPPAGYGLLVPMGILGVIASSVLAGAFGLWLGVVVGPDETIISALLMMGGAAAGGAVSATAFGTAANALISRGKATRFHRAAERVFLKQSERAKVLEAILGAGRPGELEDNESARRRVLKSVSLALDGAERASSASGPSQ